MTAMMVVKKVPPDGGWGWFIVLGSSMINLFTRAIEPSFGLLFGDLLNDLGLATTGASIIVSTLDAIINFTGLFVGPLIKRLNYRKVAIIGGFLSSFALLTTSLANSFIHLLITFSLIGGIGFGLATASTFVGINSYFNKKKAQAVGLSMAGTAVGFMAMPQVVSLLLSEYDFRSALLILGALSLHAVAGALLFQPVELHMRSVIKDIEKQPIEEIKLIPDKINRKYSKNFDETLAKFERKTSLAVSDPPPTDELPRHFSGTNLVSLYGGKKQDFKRSTSSTGLSRRKQSVISDVSLVDLTGSSIHIEYAENIKEEDDDDCGLEITFSEKGDLQNCHVDNKQTEVGCWDKFIDLFDLNLLKDGVYLNILYGASVSMVAEMNFKLIIPFFLGSLGYTKSEIAMSLSAMALADILARVIIPPIFDRITISKRVTLMVGSVLVSICRSCLAEQTETGPLMFFLIIHGFFRGMTLINFPLVLSEYSSGDNFPAVLGLSMVSKGIFIVVLGPLSGYLRDVTQSYPIFIHCQSVMIFSMVVAWSIELMMRKEPIRTKREDSN